MSWTRACTDGRLALLVELRAQGAPEQAEAVRRVPMILARARLEVTTVDLSPPVSA